MKKICHLLKGLCGREKLNKHVIYVVRQLRGMIRSVGTYNSCIQGMFLIMVSFFILTFMFYMFLSYKVNINAESRLDIMNRNEYIR